MKFQNIYIFSSFILIFVIGSISLQNHNIELTKLDDTKKNGNVSAFLTKINQNVSDLQSFISDLSYIYVISLQGVQNAHKENRQRLDLFRTAWTKKCAKIPNIKVCPGVLHEKKGYGLTKSYISCFSEAIKSQKQYTLFFEDDARLIDDNLCHKSTWNNLPNDTFVLLLGGHNFKYRTNAVKKYQEIVYSFGTYGFMVPFQNLEILRRGYEQDLLSGKHTLSPDITLYEHAKKAHKRVYKTNPLLVYHAAGYSNTHKIMRKSIDAPIQNFSLNYNIVSL